MRWFRPWTQTDLSEQKAIISSLNWYSDKNAMHTKKYLTFLTSRNAFCSLCKRFKQIWKIARLKHVCNVMRTTRICQDTHVNHRFYDTECCSRRVHWVATLSSCFSVSHEKWQPVEARWRLCSNINKLIAAVNIAFALFFFVWAVIFEKGKCRRNPK